MYAHVRVNTPAVRLLSIALAALFVGTAFSGILVATVIATAPTASAASTPAYPTFFNNDTGIRGGEPSVAVTKGDSILASVGTSLVRSKDGGKTWTDITPPGESVTTLDQRLVVDRVSNRAFFNQLLVACSIISYSDNPDGATSGATDWVVGLPCGKPGEDHEVLAVGPVAPGATIPNLPTYSRALYYTYSDIGTASDMVARSVDGGDTWLDAAPAAVGTTDRGITGATPSGFTWVDQQNGNVYAEWTKVSTDEHWVSVSSDGGINWNKVAVGTSPGDGANLAGGSATDGGLGSDAASHVYSAWANRDGSIHFSYSTDNGTSWSAPIPISTNYAKPPNGYDVDGVIRSTIYPTLIAGAKGRVAIAYYGTEDSNKGPDNCFSGGTAGVNCRWREMLTTISGADTASPTITTYAMTDGATNGAKYVQVAAICTQGNNCLAGSDRNFDDFQSIGVDTQGWPVVAYNDACINVCGPNPPSTLVMFGKEMGVFNLNGGATSTATGTPAVKITSPVNGASVPAGSTPVSGFVNRDSTAANHPPTATLSANQTTGKAPLSVSFALGAADSDGTIASWSFDANGDGTPEQSGSGVPPASESYTFSNAGTYVAKLTVTDDQGATGAASVTVTVTTPVTGVPTGDGTINANIFMYNEGGVGASNVAALVTGTATGDSTPRYAAGEPSTQMETRCTASADGSGAVTGSTVVKFYVYDSTATIAAGPFTGTGATENPTTSGCTGAAYSFTPATFAIPATWAGDYYIVPVATVAGVQHVIGQKHIIVVGAAVPPPPSTGGPGPADTGHTIGDVDNDAKTPFTEIQWADAAVAPSTLNVVIKVAQVDPAPAGDTAWQYEAIVNGVDIESFMFETGPGTWDNTNAQKAGSSTTTWDSTANTITLHIDRAYLASVGITAPYNVHVESREGEGLQGGKVVDDRAPDAGEVALTASAKPGDLVRQVTQIPLGSSSDPEVTDPPGDSHAPWMDITKVWIDHETATTFDVTEQVADMSSQPPSVDAGVAKASTTYEIDFKLDNNLNHGTDGPLFQYRIQAVNGATGVTSQGGIVGTDGTSSCTLTGVVNSAAFNTAAGTVTWRLNRAAFNVKANSASVSACQTAPPVLGGAALVDGTTLSSLTGSTGNSAGAVVIATTSTLGDTTDAGSARPYVFGQTSTPLGVAAGGPYSGSVGAAISIGATVTGGASPYTCAWSGADASFASASSCATTVSYAAAGAHLVTVSVTDSASHTASASATVNVAASGERVEIHLDGASSALGSVATTTSGASPTQSWSLNVDLSGLSGQHSLTAKWFDADNTLLATHIITVTVGAAGAAAVSITSPGSDPTGASPVHGTISVAGKAGHGGIGGATGATGLGTLAKASVVSGSIAKPCTACLASLAQPLGASAAWIAGPKGAANGVDGAWLDVTGLAGLRYSLASPEGAALDLVFFASPGDAQVQSTGANVGPIAVKTGVIPAGSAWAFVTARDVAGTARLTAFSQFGVPNAPLSLAATSVANGIALAWKTPSYDGGSAVTSFKLYRDGSLVATLAPELPAFSDLGLAAGSSHSYTVTAVNVAGESVSSLATAAIPGDANAPVAPPSGVAPKVATAGSTGTVTLALDGTTFATVAADTTTSDPASWSTSLDTTTYADGAHTLSAHYDDGAGGTADASIAFAIGNAGSITITSPASGASTARSFTAAGTTTGAGPFTVTTRVVGVTDWTNATYDGSSFTQAISGLVPGGYTLEARLVNASLSTVATASVAFTAVNAAPTANAGPDATAKPGATITLQGSGSDPDHDPLTFSWTQTSGPTVTISNPNGAGAFFTAPDVSTDTTFGFHLVVSDPYGGSAADDVLVTVKAQDNVTIDTVNGQAIVNGDAGTLVGNANVAGGSHLASGSGSANQPPVAYITGFTVNGLTIAASGATSIDPDGSIVSYAWTFGDATGASTPTVTHTYAAAGSYTLTLTVTDDKGAVGQAMFGPFAVTAPLPAAFVANAGDSKFVKIGDPITLTATSFGATGAVTYQWDTNGDGIADTGGQAISVASTGMNEGSHAFKVFATDGAGHTATDTVNALLYKLTSVAHPFDMAVLAGVPDEQAGASGAVDGNTKTYTVDVPAGSTDLTAVLKWNNYVQPVPDSSPIGGMGEDDFDMYVTSPVAAQNTQSAGGTMPEHVDVPAPAAGTWSFEVDPYVAANDHYYLFVNTTQAPVDPVPFITQTSNTCLASANQLVSVGVTGGSGVTGAWDLDLDGNFNDAFGLSAVTHFAQDGSAHLVRFRATTSDGYRATMFVAVRGAASCANLPSVVVIGFADTGINPYSKEFAGEFTPYPELRAFTTADPANLGPKDVVVRSHATTSAANAGDVLPFTKYPGDYIPNYGINAQPLKLTLGGGFYKSLDDAAIWNQGHAVIPLDQWFWFPGTKIVAAIDTSDSVSVGSPPDATPIFDDEGHGTASVSVAAGNTVGSCERCVIAFAEGLSGDGVFYDLPWVDFFSESAGALGNVGTPDTGTGLLDNVAASKAAAERGQTHAFAAGNGYENAFVSPEQTYTSDWTGPDWNIRVGAVDKTDDTAVLGTGKPVLWSSYGSGNIPAACATSYLAGCNHSGTSAATPISTGNMADSLLNARIAIGDTLAGQKTTSQANGQSQAVAVGTPIPASMYLSDGVLTRAELWRANFLCASTPGSGIGFPGDGPATPVDYAYVGYGVADAAESACATQALLGTHAAPAANANADQFFDVDHKIRQELWGTWNGPTDHPSSISATPIGPILKLDVDSLDKATKTLHDTIAKLGIDASAVAVSETYYLHRTVCANSATDPIFMDRTPAATKEAGDGCTGVTTGMSQTWTSTITSASAFAAGSQVIAHVKGFTLVPEVNVVMTGSLSGDLTGALGAGTDTESSTSVAAVSTPCTDWIIKFVTTKDVPAGTTLTLSASTQNTGDVAMCYEGGAASSRVVITGASSGGGGSNQPTAAITSPVQGADFDPAKGPVPVSGTATFPPVSTTQELYLRRDGCSNLNTDKMYLSPVDGPDAGNGCALAAGAAAPALNAAGAPFIEKYPLIASQLPLQLTSGGTVAGTLQIGCTGPDPYQLEISLVSSAGVVGTTTVTGTCLEVAGTPGPTAQDFSFPVANAVAGASLGSLELDVQIDLNGAQHWTELDAPPSFVNIPRLSTSGGKSVQVAIDDPSFATGLLAVTGTDSWSASWDLTSAASGPHTIYARAGSSGSYGPLTSVGVTVTPVTPPPPSGTVQVQAVPSGTTPDGASWTTVPNDAKGAWSYLWNTNATGAGVGPVDFHARLLLSNGTEVARSTFTANLNNPRAPVFDALGTQATVEGRALTFTVHATDANGDALAYGASGLPGNATFDPATRTFDWWPNFQTDGSYPVTFTVTDGTFTTTKTVTVLVLEDNIAPTFASIGPQKTDENRILRFTVSATGHPGDVVVLGATDLPAGATFDPTTGAFAWRPNFHQAGNYTLNFTASDEGAIAKLGVPTEVVNVNSPPSFSPTDNQSTSEGQRLSFLLTAFDEEHDPLTFGLVNPPAGTTLTSSGDVATFIWTPDYTQAGRYVLEFSVSDGQYTVFENVTVTVANVDRAPVFATLGAQSGAEASPLTFTASATDPDAGDTVTLSATGLPSGATFTPASGVFSWTPGYDAAEVNGGHYTVTLTASDGNLTTSLSVSIVIANTNRPPVASFTAPTVARANATVGLASTSTDPDAEALTYLWQFGDGANSTLANPTHVYALGGTYTVTLTATDPEGAASSATKDLLVDATPPTTVAAVTGNHTADGWYDENVKVALSATDPGAGLNGTKYGVDASPTKVYATPFGLPSGEVSHVVKFRSDDKVGNVEATKSITVKVDTVAPSTHLDLQGPLAVVVTPTNLTANVSDLGSGVDHVDFLVDQVVVCTDRDGSDGWGCRWTPDPTFAGRHAIAVFAYDRLGHKGSDSVNALVVPSPVDLGQVPTAPSANGPGSIVPSHPPCLAGFDCGPGVSPVQPSWICSNADGLLELGFVDQVLALVPGGSTFLKTLRALEPSVCATTLP